MVKIKDSIGFRQKGMVDVGSKDITRRKAVASASVSMSPQIFEILMQEGSPKGNVFEAAKLAGILAAKMTPQLIPMCHPILLDKIHISFEPKRGDLLVEIISEVSSEGKTGVEVEAMVAVSVAALTIYDMMKWAGKDMTISDIKLLKKTGGKSGDYQRA